MERSSCLAVRSRAKERGKENHLPSYGIRLKLFTWSRASAWHSGAGLRKELEIIEQLFLPHNQSDLDMT